MRPRATPFPVLGPEYACREWLIHMMAVVSPLWTSEVGKTLMLVFELGGCLVQCPGKTLLVLAFETGPPHLLQATVLREHHQDAPQPFGSDQVSDHVRTPRAREVSESPFPLLTLCPVPCHQSIGELLQVRESSQC